MHRYIYIMYIYIRTCIHIYGTYIHTYAGGEIIHIYIYIYIYLYTFMMFIHTCSYRVANPKGEALPWETMEDLGV